MAASVRRLLCLLYPAWIRKHLLTKAITDASGHFQACVFPSCHCADLNLYFTASVARQGAAEPVYDPRPIAAFTYWDYQSGTEVSLLATSEPTVALALSPARDAERASLIAAGSA